MIDARRSIAVIAIVGALGFAGCGDDDDDDTSAATEETGASGATGVSGAALPEDVVAEGNEICEAGNEEIAEAFGEVDPNAKPEEVEQIVTDEVVPNIQSQIDELRSLDDSEELQSVLDDAEELLDGIESDPQSIVTGDDPFADINSELSGLGLTACAE